MNRAILQNRTVKISVIVPVYNVEQYIEQCIRSIAQQSFSDFELLLVDDCGTDKSMAVAVQVLKEYPDVSVRVITHSVNQGLSAARNTGMRLCEGEYVCFVDSDDFLEIDALEKLVVAIGDSNADFVMADFWDVDHRGKGRKLVKRVDYSRLASTPVLKSIEYWSAMRVAAWNTLIKRELIQKHNLTFTDGMLYEDQLWSMKILFATQRVLHLAQPTYCYRLRENSIITSVAKPLNIVSWLSFYEDAEKLINANSTQLTVLDTKNLRSAVDSRKVVTLKQIIELDGATAAQKRDYMSRLKKCSSKLELDRSKLPPFSRALSYALNMPPAIGYLYAKILNKMPHSR